MQEPAKESEKSDTPLLAVSIIFGLFGVLVLAFMVYIIHRVRYRHLYMQVNFTTSCNPTLGSI